MSVSSVSNRPAPPAVPQQPAREPVKAAAKETQQKPKVEAQHKAQAQPQAEAQPIYTKVKEKTASANKGQRVDMRA
jgi:hypothetical protein